jgi:hypothetical protein
MKKLSNKKTYSIRLDPEVVDKIREQAKKESRTLSGQINFILQNYENKEN